MPMVSVIVPVYNADKYLTRCIKSILNQTFKDFELILINDGSTDKSGDICDRYSKKDSRIVYVYKKNTGVSDTRNYGLAIASGEYIMFCDSDDFVEPEWMEVLMNYIRIYPTSMVNCEYCNVNVSESEKKVIQIPECNEVTSIPLEDFFKVYKFAYQPYLWIRVYNAKIIKENNICFNKDVNSGEDVLFNLKYMKFCNNFIYIPYVGYNWVDNGSKSATRRYDPYYYNIIKELYFPRKEFVASKDMQAFCDEYFYRFYNCFEIVMDSRNKMTKKEKINYCNFILNDRAFKDALINASEHACNTKLKKILNFGNYRLIMLFNWLMDFKTRK